MKYIGVDLGGTHIGVGIVDDEKGIIYKDECNTQAHRQYKDIMMSIVDLCKKIVKESGVDFDEIQAIGIGVPGIETPEGLAHAKNLSWYGVPLREDIAKELDKKTFIDNDAHAAALAELGFGSLIGVEDAVMLTLGTGVGGAMIVNKKILAGHNNAGGELGHITFVCGGIQCTCGRKGCLEKYASATALIRIGKEYAQKHPDSILHSIVGGIDNLSAKGVIDGAREGDRASTLAFEDYCEYLSDAIVSFINVLNPQKICLGGGVSKAGEFLFEVLRKKCKTKYFSPLHNDTEIVPALLKNDAGILGAAMVAKQQL